MIDVQENMNEENLDNFTGLGVNAQEPLDLEGDTVDEDIVDQDTVDEAGDTEAEDIVDEDTADEAVDTEDTVDEDTADEDTVDQDAVDEAEDIADEAEDIAAQAENLDPEEGDIANEAEDIAEDSEELAAEAEALAEDSEELAAEAEALATQAEELAAQAEELATQAEELAEDSEELADEAEELAEDSEELAVEAEALADEAEAEAEGEDIDAEAEGEDIDAEAEDIDAEDGGDIDVEDLDIDAEDGGDIDVEDLDNNGGDAPVEAPEVSDGSILGAPVGGPPDAQSPEIILDEFQGVSIVNEDPTISVIWDNAAQEATAAAGQGPTASAYQFALLHTAIFDAYSAYDPTAINSTTGNDDLQRPDEENTDANKVEAASFAAYNTLSTLLPEQEEIFADVLRELGFEPDTTLDDPTTAAGIGNIAAQTLLESRANDGSNALGNDPNGDGTAFSDTTGFTTPNTPDNVEDIELFTLENTPINNDPLADDTAQSALTPQFGDVDPFALESGDQFRPDGPEGFLVDGVEAEVDLDAGTITLEDGTVEEISTDLIGTIINPGFIEQAEEIIDVSANLTDEQKLIAEFWEDGPGTSFPPGNGQAFGQFVSARDNNTLDEDVELFFSLGNSQLDSAIAAWDSKYAFNYARPLRAIRELGRQGLIGEFNEELGGNAIEAYAGPGQGTQTILAEDFITYQFGPDDASPPFPEYVSGHSTFSAAAAEVLQQATGSDEFGASVSFDPGSSRFEPGLTPADTVTLEYDTFTDFADESGISRIYGGIHFEDGDLDGRQLGREVGQAAFDRAQFFINGGDGASDPVTGNDGTEALAGSGASGNEDDSLIANNTDINPQSDIAPITSGDEITPDDAVIVDPLADAEITGIGDDPLGVEGNVLNNGDEDLLFAPSELATV